MGSADAENESLASLTPAVFFIKDVVDLIL
jgi:hypothetical protein